MISEGRPGTRCAAATGFILFLFVATRANATVIASFRDANPQIATVAGNGEAGTTNGPANIARFLTPTAIAVDRQSGTIYVADAAANQIRAIDAHGVVSTVAGTLESAGTMPRSQSTYRDGKASDARFNRPTGIAVAADGSIYVADSGNHCVRHIAAGMVTTLTGQPDRAVAADGPVAAASFHDPRAIAVAKDGTIFVADYGAGIRAVKNDAVTTLPIPNDHSLTISDLSLWDGDGQILFYVTRGLIGRFDLTGNRDVGTPSGGSGGVTTTGVVALGNGIFAATSATIHTIFIAAWEQNWRVLTGPANRDTGVPGGFRDGAPADARFDAPLGIAATADGTLLVADAGNRRVRSISAPNLRNNNSPPPDFDPSVYRIAFVSNSYAFANSTWDDSIAGIIEKQLNDNGAALGLTKTVRVQALNLGNDLGVHQQYLEQVTALDSTALVIWSVNPGMFVKDFDPIWVFRPPDVSAGNLERIRALMTHTAAVLKDAGKSLVIADQPFGSQVPPTESIVYREYVADTATPQDRATVLQFQNGDFTAIERFLGSLGIPHFETYDTFVQVEHELHVPLWALDEEGHFSPVGNMFYGNLLASYLMKTRPWRQQPVPLRKTK